MRVAGGGGGDGGTHKPSSDAKPLSPSVWGVLGGGCHHHNAKPSPHYWPYRNCKPFFLFHWLVLLLLLFVMLLYLLYSYNTLFSPLICCDAASDATDDAVIRLSSSPNFSTGIRNGSRADAARSSPMPPFLALALPSRFHAPLAAAGTGLHHIVFGIAASAKMWEKRKAYIKVWWRPTQMRGFVWLDKPVKELNTTDPSLPVLKISGDTSRIPYTHRKGNRSAIRISRIISETYRLGLPNVRWFVMGDDDTVFIPDNLAGVLARFDHRQPYYIGSLSESHLQNIYLSYGGDGFAISAPLAAALSGFQDSLFLFRLCVFAPGNLSVLDLNRKTTAAGLKTWLLHRRDLSPPPDPCTMDRSSKLRVSRLVRGSPLSIALVILLLLIVESGAASWESHKRGKLSLFSLFNLKEKSKFWSESVIRGDFDDLESCSSSDSGQRAVLDYMKADSTKQTQDTDKAI